VAPSAYRLEAKLPGFASLLNELTLASGEGAQRTLTLRVGSIVETVTVNCASAAATVTIPSPAPRHAQDVPSFDLRDATSRLWTAVRASLGLTPTFAAQAPPLRVGGQIRAPRRTKDATPACPGVPIGSGGVVLLEAVIGADGLIKDAKILRSIDKRPEFGQTAIDAVRQWEFTPTLLNGAPVSVIMTVTVVYAPI
jgi:TonB family protein